MSPKVDENLIERDNSEEQLMEIKDGVTELKRKNIIFKGSFLNYILLLKEFHFLLFTMIKIILSFLLRWC